MKPFSVNKLGVPLVSRHTRLVLAALLLTSCGGSGGGQPPPPSSLSYPAVQSFVVGRAIAPLAPTVTGRVSAYVVSPALPAGLTISASTGVILGTPSTLTPLANYTVRASNSSGSTSTVISIAVNEAPPAFTYGRTSLILTPQMNVQLTPTNTGGIARGWSVSPALPAGLALDPSTGSITGTPTTVTSAATYVVTAQDSGGSASVPLTLSVDSGILLDLGHAGAIGMIRLSASRVLASEGSHWVLWDYAAGAKLADSTIAPCPLADLDCIERQRGDVDLAGSILVINTGGLEVRSALDGTVRATINTYFNWWKLASDGSYICTGSDLSLQVWSPDGTLVLSRAGNYNGATVFAAPGQLQIATGPAGLNVVETVSLPAGTSSVSAAFQGQFWSWYLDGERFLSNSGNTVWTYSKTAVQEDLTLLPAFFSLTGQGSWFWTVPPSPLGNQSINIYKVGASSAPAATFSISSTVGVTAVPSGLTIGVLDNGVTHVIDLSGPNPRMIDHATPVAHTQAYAAISPSEWVVGNPDGVLVDGASLAGSPRYFGHGAAWSIAGGGQRVAVATASGEILFFDATTKALEGTIPFTSSQVVLSDDGAVLVAAGDENDGLYHTDWSIRVYALPGGKLINTWPYTFGTYPLPYDVTLSASGTAVGQLLKSDTITCVRQVSSAAGGPVLWSDTVSSTHGETAFCRIPPIRPSPDGTLVAVSNARGAGSATSIYRNGAFVAAVPGWALSWLDNGRLLIQNYNAPSSVSDGYAGSTIYDPSGVKLGASPLPELAIDGGYNASYPPATLFARGTVQVVTPDSVYDPDQNSIFSVSTGVATWTWTNSQTYPSGPGAVAGSRVVFASGNLVLAEPY